LEYGQALAAAHASSSATGGGDAAASGDGMVEVDGGALAAYRPPKTQPPPGMLGAARQRRERAPGWVFAAASVDAYQVYDALVNQFYDQGVLDRARFSDFLEDVLRPNVAWCGGSMDPTSRGTDARPEELAELPPPPRGGDAASRR
jgi:hypothetical protein